LYEFFHRRWDPAVGLSQWQPVAEAPEPGSRPGGAAGDAET